MSSAHFISWVERQGQRVRRRLSLPPLAPLDPYTLAISMQVPVIGPRDIAQLDPDIVDHLIGPAAKSWSGGCLHFPDGRAVVVLNPTHAYTRKHATLMEELMHIDLNHPPSRMSRTGDLVVRSYNKSKETEAYWVGSAALVTRQHLLAAAQLEMLRASVAVELGVSELLVKFRENVTGIKL